MISMTILAMLELATPNPVPEAIELPAPVQPREDDPPPKWNRRGYGLLVPGVILVGGLAPPLIGWSAALAVDSRRCFEQTMSSECGWASMGAVIMLPIAVIAVAVGTPLLVIGAVRLRRWKQWQREHAVALRPTLRGTPRSVLVGLELRF